MERGAVVGPTGEHVVPSLDRGMRRAELGTVRVAATVRSVAVVATEGGSVGRMSGR